MSRVAIEMEGEVVLTMLDKSVGQLDGMASITVHIICAMQDQKLTMISLLHLTEKIHTTVYIQPVLYSYLS